MFICTAGWPCTPPYDAMHTYYVHTALANIGMLHIVPTYGRLRTQELACIEVSTMVPIQAPVAVLFHVGRMGRLALRVFIAQSDLHIITGVVYQHAA